MHRQNRHTILKAANYRWQDAEATDDQKGEENTVDNLVYGYMDRAGHMVSRGLKDKSDTQHEEMKELKLRELGVTPTTVSTTKFGNS